MKKILFTMTVFAFCFCLGGSAPLMAEGETVATEVAAGTGTASSETVTISEPVAAPKWKEQLKEDKAKIQAEKQEMKQHGSEARAEEKALRQQMKDARVAGDTAKAKEIQAQLKTTHQANVQERKADVKQLKEAKKELRADKKGAWKNRADRNKNGAVDAVEKKKAKKRGWFGR